jgi:hypothetical protein
MINARNRAPLSLQCAGRTKALQVRTHRQTRDENKQGIYNNVLLPYRIINDLSMLMPVRRERVLGVGAQPNEMNKQNFLSLSNA